MLSLFHFHCVCCTLWSSVLATCTHLEMPIRWLFTWFNALYYVHMLINASWIIKNAYYALAYMFSYNISISISTESVQCKVGDDGWRRDAFKCWYNYPWLNLYVNVRIIANSLLILYAEDLIRWNYISISKLWYFVNQSMGPTLLFGLSFQYPLHYSAFIFSTIYFNTIYNHHILRTKRCYLEYNQVA